MSCRFVKLRALPTPMPVPVPVCVSVPVSVPKAWENNGRHVCTENSSAKVKRVKPGVKWEDAVAAGRSRLPLCCRYALPSARVNRVANLPSPRETIFLALLFFFFFLLSHPISKHPQLLELETEALVNAATASVNVGTPTASRRQC